MVNRRYHMRHDDGRIFLRVCCELCTDDDNEAIDRIWTAFAGAIRDQFNKLLIELSSATDDAQTRIDDFE